MKTASVMIKELRASLGMNQREFAEHVGISVRTIQDWESGRRVPPDYIPRLLRYQIAYEKICNRQKVLIVYFSGTSAETIANYIAYDRVALPSDKKKDVEILLHKIKQKKYDYIICIGQKPGIADSVKVEIEAHGDVTLVSSADCNMFAELLKQNGVEAAISAKPGNSYCNNIYWHGLKYLKDNKNNTKMLFLHVPFKKNIRDIDGFAQTVVESINLFINE